MNGLCFQNLSMKLRESCKSRFWLNEFYDGQSLMFKQNCDHDSGTLMLKVVMTERR